jgi:hypothetical protein
MLFAMRSRHSPAVQCSMQDNTRPLLRLLQPLLLGFWPLFSLFIASEETVYADWVTVEKPSPVRELQTVYIDPTTVRREGNLTTVWQLTDVTWMQGGARGTPRFLSTKTYKQFECTGKRLRLLAFTEFSHQMATGIASDGHVDKETWLPVEPDSINHALWELVCGQP